MIKKLANSFHLFKVINLKLFYPFLVKKKLAVLYLAQAFPWLSFFIFSTPATLYKYVGRGMRTLKASPWEINYILYFRAPSFDELIEKISLHFFKKNSTWKKINVEKLCPSWSSSSSNLYRVICTIEDTNIRKFIIFKETYTSIEKGRKSSAQACGIGKKVLLSTLNSCYMY